MNIVAVHQPNYLPWLGFFDKIVKCNTFVILDDVQFPKSSRGTWTNRTRILTPNGPAWITVPVQRPHGVQRIDQVRTVGEEWKRRHRTLIHQHYRKAPNYETFSDFLDSVYAPKDDDSLIAFNLNSLRLILEVLGFSERVELRLSSSLSVGSTGSARLTELVQLVGGDTYLCGGGSEGYLEPRLFQRAGIELIFQNFVEPQRAQAHSGQFIAGLSVIDSLLCAGRQATIETLVM
jgi:hypothetical protein